MVQGNESWLETYWRLTIGEKYWRQLLLSCFLGKPICSIGEAKKWRNWFESSRALNCGIASVFGNMWFDLLVPLSCSQYQERLHLLVFRANLQLEYFSGCNIVQCFFWVPSVHVVLFLPNCHASFLQKTTKSHPNHEQFGQHFWGETAEQFGQTAEQFGETADKTAEHFGSNSWYFFTVWFFLGQFSCSNSANTCWFCLSK